MSQKIEIKKSKVMANGFFLLAIFEDRKFVLPAWVEVPMETKNEDIIIIDDTNYSKPKEITKTKIEKKCKAILKSGKRKGDECGVIVKDKSEFCGKHKK